MYIGIWWYQFSKNRINFFVSRPNDHFYDFNPHSFKTYLERLGFYVYEISIPSIYFERFKNAFPIISKFINKNLYKKFCNITKFGDTCEIYAYKK